MVAQELGFLPPTRKVRMEFSTPDFAIVGIWGVDQQSRVLLGPQFSYLMIDCLTWLAYLCGTTCVLNPTILNTLSSLGCHGLG